MERKPFLLFLFLLPALFLALPQPLFPLESGQENPALMNPQSSNDALNRLTEISNQLSLLNEKLRIELLDSRQSSRELQIMLELSRQELEGLRNELEYLRIVSAELLSRAESSQTESTELLTALRKAEYSLVSLEQSFAVYRLTAEQRISRLEKENRLWKWGCIVAGVLAAGLGTYIAFSR
jgi:hypothetical protein